jgi:hypothetical protein
MRFKGRGIESFYGANATNTAKKIVGESLPTDAKGRH